jgi:hypothetical protein
LSGIKLVISNFTVLGYAAGAAGHVRIKIAHLRGLSDPDENRAKSEISASGSESTFRGPGR